MLLTVKCRIVFIIMLNVIMLSAVMLSVVAPPVFAVAIDVTHSRNNLKRNIFFLLGMGER
jgi:hypothetical protein